ncbi:uncharacterized protein PgNI_12330 [Pyricularia grisea]|uniref:DUF6606 domain-containing protein n=1 Tax=Pyricularia grisea TaxID=148305 RepID=A0A6P8AMP6_PYRGI|nr:uncharacterized protein PgNI_12330 [Pyricularia grisea]TLD03313.1 hypothetical protein PgNI_12330 [Pyricularia grisea]
MTTNKTAFDYVVNHFFLPPKLPQGDDWTPSNGSTLQSALLASIEKFRAFVVSRRYALVDSAAAMIRRMVMAQDETGNINCDNLGKVLQEIGQSGASRRSRASACCFPECRRLFTRHKDSVYIETFELALNSAVMESPGRLRRYFPGYAMAMDLDIFRDPKFQSCFASILHKLGHQDAPGTCPRVKLTVVSQRWKDYPFFQRLSISDTTSDASPPTRHKLCPQILNQFDRVSSVHEAHPANHAARLNLFDLENVGSPEKI